MSNATEVQFAARVAEFARAESEAALALARSQEARLAAMRAKPAGMTSVAAVRILREAALQVHGARPSAGGQA